MAEKRADEAVSTYNQGFNCAQAVLSSFCEELGVDKKTALRITASFGGGMARMGKTCGAVIGALMVIGLKFARGRSSKEKIFSEVKRFVKEFETRNASIECRELLGCDLSTPEGFEEAARKSLLKTLCPKFVRDSVEILEEKIG